MKAKEDPLKKSSRELLSCISPRSPNSRKGQHFELSITGSNSAKSNESKDSSVGFILPDVICGHGLPISNNIEEESIKFKINKLVNSYDLVLIVLNERLRDLEKRMSKHVRKSRALPFRTVMTNLLRDTHKLYCVQLALLTLLDPAKTEEAEFDGANAAANHTKFDSFDYQTVLEDPNTKIVFKSVQRWFIPFGKIHKTFQEIHKHLRNFKKEGFDYNNIEISAVAFDKLEEAHTRCLERMDAANNALNKFDLKTAATAVHAAIRFRKLSPKASQRSAAAKAAASFIK